MSGAGVFHPDDVQIVASWRKLAASAGLRDFDATGASLLRAYSEPHRHYHDRGHVAFLLNEIETRAVLIADPQLLGFAAWFHDAIYDPLAKDNEERSADWARADLIACGLDARRAYAVSMLILKTASHHAGDATPDEALFLDMDFAILGANRAIYESYARNIRAEYAAVPEPTFRAGRAAFLKGVLAQPRMFRTSLYEDESGDNARANLAWEIARLESGASLDG